MPLWFGRPDDDAWKEALSRVEARVRALEEARAADQVERADWAERIERLFNRVRMASTRASRGKGADDDQASLLDPPEQVGSLTALRRKRGY